MYALHDTRDDAEYDIAQLKKALRQEQSFSKRMKLSRAMCKAIQNIGIIDILLFLDPIKFSSSMVSAGEHWKSFLSEAEKATKGGKCEISDDDSCWSKALLEELSEDLYKEIVEKGWSADGKSLDTVLGPEMSSGQS